MTIHELRYRAAIAIDRAICAAASSIDSAADHVAHRIGDWMPWVRGYGSRIGRRLTPCGCEPTSRRLFCSRKRPPRPGGYFQEDCNCCCHDRKDLDQ